MTVGEPLTKPSRIIWHLALGIGGFVAGLVTPALVLILDAIRLPAPLALLLPVLLPVAAFLGLFRWGRHRVGLWERSVGAVLFLGAVLAGAMVLPSWVMQQKHAYLSSPPAERNGR